MQTSGSQGLLWSRLSVGVLQGLVLVLLVSHAPDGDQLDAYRWLHIATVLVAIVVFPVVALGLGYLKPARLPGWCAALSVAVGAIGYQDASYHAKVQAARSITPTLDGSVPSLQIALLCAVLAYIACALIFSREKQRRNSHDALYETCFECSWKMALQILLSATFVAILHLVLWTGAALFLLLGLSFFKAFLGHSWFYIPVSTVAFMAGLHLTDVRTDIVRGTQTLLLALLSWLLPLLVLITAGFLVSFLLTGLRPLWATHSATSLLLGVAALQVALINAAFGNGLEAHVIPRILRASIRAACVMLPALVILAGYALEVRIAQHGFSPHRITACACTFIAGCYALGYMCAAFGRRVNLQRIAGTNIVAAYLSLGVLFLVCVL